MLGDTFVVPILPLIWQGLKQFLPSFLTKTSLGSNRILVLSLASINLYAGFPLLITSSIISFSSLNQLLYAVPQQASSRQSFYSREEEKYMLCFAAFGLKFILRIQPRLCKLFLNSSKGCSIFAVIPRELEIMEDPKILAFKAVCSLLAKGWNVIAEYGQNMVIREKVYKMLIIEESCQS